MKIILIIVMGLSLFLSFVIMYKGEGKLNKK